jgi:hypothetical protein
MPAKASRRQVQLLGVLVLVLAAVLVYEFRPQGGAAPASRGAAVTPGPSRAAAARDRAASVPEVRLPDLKGERPAPAETGRNPFTEKPKAPPPVVRPVVAPPPPPDPNAPPPPPPPPPPITLKLIAIVQGSGKALAALTDGKDVFYGREGDVIEGRYRIVKVNVESIDIAYVDGRGQRRIGLSG